jgi:hypothetical protein
LILLNGHCVSKQNLEVKMRFLKNNFPLCLIALLSFCGPMSCVKKRTQTAESRTKSAVEITKALVDVAKYGRGAENCEKYMKEHPDASNQVRERAKEYRSKQREAKVKAGTETVQSGIDLITEAAKALEVSEVGAMSPPSLLSGAALFGASLALIELQAALDWALQAKAQPIQDPRDIDKQAKENEAREKGDPNSDKFVGPRQPVVGPPRPDDLPSDTNSERNIRDTDDSDSCAR